MFYTDLDPMTQRTVISEVTSSDGMNWSPASPVGAYGSAFAQYGANTLVQGTDGSDRAHLESPEIFQHGDDLMLVYAGYSDEAHAGGGFPASLYLSRSIDGGAFELVSDQPILEPTPGWYDNDAIYSPSILAHDGGYLMVYAGHAYTDTSKIDGPPGVRLLGATSTDGVNWTKLPAPILEADPTISWMSHGVAEASLTVGPDGDYYLFFTGLENEDRVIGMARATDPMGDWEVAPEPIMVPDGEGFNATKTLAPHVMFDGDTLKMWYLATDEAGFLSIGHAQTTFLTPTPISGDATGGRTADVFEGDDGDNVFNGRGNDDILFGAGGEDILSGHRGADVLKGGAGNDRLKGGGGDDTLQGGSGGDHLNAGAGNNSLNGGGGLDTVSYGNAAAAVDVNLAANVAHTGVGGTDALYNIENVIGSKHGDVLTGDDAANKLRGGGGNDALIGGGGDDFLDGGAGSDYLIGGAGADIFRFTSDAEGGFNTILDFNRDEGDKIRISTDINGLDLQDTDDILSLYWREDDGNTIIYLGDPDDVAAGTPQNEWIIVSGRSDLTADDFIIA